MTCFTVKRPLKVYDYTGVNSFLIAKGTVVSVENNSEFHTIDGATKPHHLMIDKFKIPNGTIRDPYPLLEQGKRYSFVDLDFQNGSIKSTRSLW